MKISKQLSKILISVSFFLFVQSAQAQEIKEIWSEIEKKEATNTKSTNDVVSSSDSNQLESVKVKLSDENIVVDQNLDNSNILLAGLFDPDENDLKLDMWSKTDGTKIKKLLEKIQSKNLSSFSERLMDVALLTNSYIPNQNFTLDEFENFTLDHLIKKKDFDLVEEFIQKNSLIKDKERLIKHVADYYLSLNKIENSCAAIDSLSLITDEYLTYFKIYCLITQNRKDEAQLLFDLNSELDSLNDFFVKKFEVLMGYEDNNFILSDENVLYFHLSHKTDKNFLYSPNSYVVHAFNPFSPPPRSSYTALAAITLTIGSYNSSIELIPNNFNLCSLYLSSILICNNPIENSFSLLGSVPDFTVSVVASPLDSAIATAANILASLGLNPTSNNISCIVFCGISLISTPFKILVSFCFTLFFSLGLIAIRSPSFAPNPLASLRICDLFCMSFIVKPGATSTLLDMSDCTLLVCRGVASWYISPDITFS